MTQIKTNGRVSKRDWLETALELLRNNGIAAVRVERLAADLEVSKSGFYYHFRDLAELQAALLDHWIELDHKPQKRLNELPDITAAERLAVIAEVVDEANLSSYDTAMRQWARKDPKVRRRWRAEMKKRIDIVRSLFAELGFTGDDLEMRTRLFITYHVCEREMFPDAKKKSRAELRKLRLRLLLSA